MNKRERISQELCSGRWIVPRKAADRIGTSPQYVMTVMRKMEQEEGWEFEHRGTPDGVGYRLKQNLETEAEGPALTVESAGTIENGEVTIVYNLREILPMIDEKLTVTSVARVQQWVSVRCKGENGKLYAFRMEIPENP